MIKYINKGKEVNRLIKEVDFQSTMESAFLAYSASVAQERAIPDVRDMLKIGLRQGLYAQFTNKLTHKDKFQKAQKSVAAAMSQSYVHGDAAMYDTFIRAARPWSYRYPLEDVQGNYGNPSSPDSHAAARYVEMKAAEISNVLFDGLKKNAIGSQKYWNYDDTEEIPSVFPSIGYWNIVNGCSGIAVAMATSVPQFNLKEVNDALIKLIHNPDISFDEIYCAPDFATGGIITNATAIKESLRVGKGESIRLRAKLEFFPEQNMIQATEIPYGVFTNTIIDQLAEITTENENYGVERVVDYTKKTADIRIYLTKGVNPKKMIEKLYKDTSLENWYSINMILLDNGRFPKIFGWKAACEAYIQHIRTCKRNIIQYDLDKAFARKNIVDGLIKAYSIIDEVVALIRNSSTPAEASTKLIQQYDFNEEQTKAILAMKLASLTKLDIVKLTDELEQLVADIERFQHLLNTPADLDEELVKILREIADKYGDARRTKLLNINEPDEEQPELVKTEEVGILLFDNNMIRVVPKDALQGAQKGRKGKGINPPKNATLINTLYTTNTSMIAAFTNRGRMYNFPVLDLEYEHDYSIYELIALQDDEQVLLLIDTTSLSYYKYLITISKQGNIKKSLVTEYNLHARKGTAAVKLADNDILINAFLVGEDDKIVIGNNSGYYNYYNLSEISATGRNTKGVKAIKLNTDEYVVSATVIRSGISYKGLLSITNDGRGKISPLEEFSTTTRAARGYQIMALKDCALSVIYAVPETQEKMFLSANNKAVILNTASIPVQNRATAGARLIDARNTNATIRIM